MNHNLYLLSIKYSLSIVFLIQWNISILLCGKETFLFVKRSIILVWSKSMKRTIYYKLRNRNTTQRHAQYFVHETLPSPGKISHKILRFYRYPYLLYDLCRYWMAGAMNELRRTALESKRPHKLAIFTEFSCRRVSHINPEIFFARYYVRWHKAT